MYEQPKLIKVGKAGEVILGIYGIGDDLDGTTWDGDLVLGDGQESIAGRLPDREL